MAFGCCSYNEAVTLDLFGFLNITLLSPNVAREAHRSFGSMYSLTPNTQVRPTMLRDVYCIVVWCSMT